MAKIKNLLFDLGGVLLNIDYNKTADAFKKLGVHQFDELYSQSGANYLFEELETGKISDEDFYDAIQQYCSPSTTKEQIESAWNAILLNFRIESLECLVKLGEEYNVYLLSNTNSIHLQAFNKIFEEETGKPRLDDYFIKAYYSHKIQQRKPYAATYKFVLSDAGIKPEETLFIDDSIVNIEGAREAGLLAYHLLPGQAIEEIKFNSYV
jgi:putative hydrolase of the HAD superfamily